MKTYAGSSDAEKISVRDVPSETTAEHSHVEVSEREGHDQLSPSVLRRTLIDAIQEELSFPARSEDIAEYSGLFAAYIDDVAVLETRRKEIFDLIETMKLTDGYLIGEKVHFTETCRETMVKTSVVEEPLHGHEPAVALGPYVLVGRGPREITAVLSQRTAATEEKRWRDQRWQWCGGALVAQLLIPPVLMASSAASGMLLLAAILFLFSVPMLTLALRRHLALKGITLSEWRVQLLVSGPAIVAAGVQSLFLPIGPVRFFLSSALILCGAWMIHSSRPHLLNGSKT